MIKLCSIGLFLVMLYGVYLAISVVGRYRKHNKHFSDLWNKKK